ncbi:MAG: hypothetical protein C4527_05650 [Candidatus Omnitrophota bacterium]|nr:MAG: hypothetical protein C4527_05650 [Candidatus Omnitrophota bacterium]
MGAGNPYGNADCGSYRGNSDGNSCSTCADEYAGAGGDGNGVASGADKYTGTTDEYPGSTDKHSGPTDEYAGTGRDGNGNTGRD